MTVAADVERHSGSADMAVPPHKLAYGVGSIGTGIFTTVPSVLLLYFLTTEIGIGAAVAGVIMLIPKLFGVFGDPLIGNWSDRLRVRSPAGRRALMLLGAFVSGAGLWALFHFPELYKGIALVPAIIYLMCTAGYSLFAVTYSALPAELDRRPEGRQSLVSARLGLSFVGALLGGVLAPLIVTRFGYSAMGMALGFVCMVSMLIFIFFCKIPTSSEEQVSREGAPEYKWRFLTSRFVTQIAAFAMLLAATGAFTALLPFLIRDMKESPDIIGVGMLVNIVSAVIASLVWPGLIRRVRRQLIWYAAAILMCTGVVMIATSHAAGFAFFTGMAVAGAGFCGVQMVGFTGLAEQAAEHLKYGHGAGLMTGVWLAAEKAGLAFGPLLAGIGLQYKDIIISGSAVSSLIIVIPLTLAVLSVVAIGLSSKRISA